MYINSIVYDYTKNAPNWTVERLDRVFCLTTKREPFD